jgi:hypothetical protein
MENIINLHDVYHKGAKKVQKFPATSQKSKTYRKLKYLFNKCLILLKLTKSNFI